MLPEQGASLVDTLLESDGLGLEDLTAAVRVLELAREREIGMEIPIR